MSFTEKFLQVIEDWRRTLDGNINTDLFFFRLGDQLTIGQSFCVLNKPGPKKLGICHERVEMVKSNSKYLECQIKKGAIIYGIGTGFGGSADVRWGSDKELQKSLIQHLNAGIGLDMPKEVIRGAILLRINSLLKAMSGVRQVVITKLIELLENDIIPLVPLRGSISASGDLMPLSYIAAALDGSRGDNKVYYCGSITSLKNALKLSNMKPLQFQSKEALAVLNSCSFAASMAVTLLPQVQKLVFLTLCVVSFGYESLDGRVDNLHPTIAKCYPHKFHDEVARSIRMLLVGSSFARWKHELDCKDVDGQLKQDRYALRTAPQWLAPVLRAITEAQDVIATEIDSVNDNPIIDSKNQQVLHGGNFQGASLSVALDMLRQACQMSGKLMFALMTEVMNSNMNKNLPPNLAGSNICTDFGFKGAETATASYCSELDWLTHPVSSHVLIAESGNQNINSLALLSARMLQQSVDTLQLMVATLLRTFVQAIDLRWLQRRSQISGKRWYKVAFHNFIGPLTDIEQKVVDDYNRMKEGECNRDVENELGQGTQIVYGWIKELGCKFCSGTTYIDTELQIIHDAIKNQEIFNLLEKLMHICDGCASNSSHIHSKL